MAGYISQLRNSRLALLALSAMGCAHAAETSLPALKYWSVGPILRISVDIDGAFKFKASRLNTPERIFFDIQGHPVLKDRKMHTIQVGEPLLKQIRVAETNGVTRIVLDLPDATTPVEFTVSQLRSPDRLMVELSSKTATPTQTSHVGSQRISAAPSSPVSTDMSGKQPKAPSAPYTPPPARAPAEQVTEPVAAPPVITAPPSSLPASPSRVPALAKATSLAPIPDLTPQPRPADPKLAGPEPIPARVSVPSMTRVLGLKLGRIVLDAGHGGHDVGTHGPSGYTEKELVLDVTLRLGELLKSRLGTEVVYTRDADNYVGLEERTNIANERKADLFLSIHANSSPYRTAAGAETYYLNFTTTKTALDLASRENAGSNKSVFDLKDQLQKIALRDKLDESQQFAQKLQSSLSTLSARSNDAAKNRGVKRAPFVVLIGATMPSVLAEIGFLTNPTDEALLKKPEHRQKIAEALYKGIAAYAESLSRFQLASR